MVDQLAQGLLLRHDAVHVVVVGGHCTGICEVLLAVSEMTPHYRLTFVNCREPEDLERRFPRASVVFWADQTVPQAAEYIDGPIDWLYVDHPGHLPRDVYSAYEFLFPKLRADSVVAFHGYGDRNPEYSDAIDRVFAGLEWVLQRTVDDETVAFRRREQLEFDQ